MAPMSCGSNDPLRLFLGTMQIDGRVLPIGIFTTQSIAEQIGAEMESHPMLT